MVEWKRLEDVCDILTGGDVPNNCIKGQTFPSDSHPYAVYSNGDGVYGYSINYRINKDAVTISSIGNVGSVNYRSAFFTPVIRLKVVIPSHPFLQTKYLYYTLLCYKFIGTNSSLSSMKAADIKRIQIPIPPLSEQTRIVGILDTFTASIENLKEQIKQRRKQYEHYRDELLDLEGKEGVEMKTLREIFETRNGYTPSTNNKDFWEGGLIPWFKMEDIRDNGRILNDSILHITPQAVKGKGLFKANSIILATSATIGEHALITIEHLSNQRFTNFYPKKSYESNINMKFVYYYMYIIDNWCKQHINQGGFASVDMAGLYNLDFPILPLSEQSRIVSILDTFDASISNLEAQLKEREKQYEYYRNKLLTFE